MLPGSLQSANTNKNIDFKIKMMSYTGTPSVVTIKKDERYWPTVEWLRDETHVEGWKRVTYENGEVIQGEGLYGIML
jgi:pro-apoptotic serine protease NMA111